jgi:LuxR family transcriptional regulator, maltose regulon positive regulatory protein
MPLYERVWSSLTVLKTKLFMPRIRAGALERPRLMDKLNSGVHRKLILISAPAGFGKSTLVAQWHAAHSGGRAPLGWVNLDAGDQDPVRFWLHALSALEGALPGATGGALAMLRAAPPPPAQSVLAVLVNALTEVEQDCFLVLDDYHLIEAEEVHAGVRYLLEHLPPSLHVGLLTRHDPPLPLARLRARGELLELRAQDLRFSDTEAADLLGALPGVDLSPDLVTALAARTEGWVAGLQLAALSLEGRADAAGFVAEFVSNHYYLVDYLVEEILHSQPEPVQQFLLHTCVLERLCAPLCEAVTGTTGARPMLEMLEQRGLFTIALDAERQWFRYHHLFADILRTHLEHAHPDRVGELQRKAAAWFAANGMDAEAIRAALAAGDCEYAASLTERAAEGFWQTGQSETLRTLLGALPGSVLALHPGLLIQRARILLLVDADVGSAKQALADAGVGLRRRELAGTAGGRLLEAQAATLEGAIARAEGAVPLAISLCQRALDALPADEGFWWPVAGLILALAYQQAGDLRAALPILREGCQRSRQAGDLFWAVTQYAILGDSELALGLLPQAHDTYQQALRLVGDSGADVRSAGLAHAGLGAVLYEWNQVDQARAQLERGREIGIRCGHFDSTWRAGKSLTQLYLMQGTPEPIRANALLGFMSSYTNVNPVGTASGKAQLAHLHLLEGNVAEAIHLCEQVGEALENGLGSAWPESLVPARVALATGRTQEAAAFLRRRLPLVEAAGVVDAEIRTLALLAVALEAAGDRAGALTALGRALELGQRGRYVRTFLDEGPTMLRLLAAARTAGVAGEYPERLLRLGGGAPAAEPPAPVKAVAAAALPDDVEPLTERELEVLRLAATGLSTQAIGASIFITPGTVKNHLHSILSKLGVSNRLQAINRAREFGWL